jgi:hypothetical protein
LIVETNDLGRSGAGGSLVDTDTLAITVREVNDPPAFTSAGSATVQENTVAVMTVAASDVDGGAPAFAIVGGADQAAFQLMQV